MRKLLSDISGFSFIEVMVSASLMGGTVLLLALQQAQQTKSQSTVAVQSQARQALTDIASIVGGNPASYPFLLNGANSVLYVGCFDMNGNPTLRSDGNRGYLAIFPDASVIRNLVFDAGNYAVVCTRGRGGFEAHVYYNSAADRRVLRISVFTLPKTGLTLPLHSYSTSISLDRF